MLIIRSPGEKFSVSDSNCKIGAVLGYFDGVHLGHQKLLEEAKKQSECVVVRMFENLPKSEFLLTTLNEKLSLLEEYGAGAVIIDDFSALRGMSGEEFFKNCISSLNPAAVVCGYNYRFGKNAAYSVKDLSAYSDAENIGCIIVPEYTINSEPVSSSRIRSLISDGNVSEAALLLGRNYSVSEKVYHGKALGRTIGYPTVNQRPPKNKAIPKNGIYSCTAEFYENGEKITRGGVCNIGFRPTVNSDENDITLETFIFDYSGDLYSKEVKISFVERLRDEKRFDSVESLKAAIENDAARARESLGKCR